MSDLSERIETEYGNAVTIPGPFENMREVRIANKAAGQFWFSPDTMRFFNCRIEGSLQRGRLFITSECREPGKTPRLYTLRAAMDDASIETVGEFQQFLTLFEARSALRRKLETYRELEKEREDD